MKIKQRVLPNVRLGDDVCILEGFHFLLGLFSHA